MYLDDYLKQVKQRLETGISTEHSYRSDLQVLLNNLVKGITVTNEPKRQKWGASDYIIQKKEVPIGYIEAKDIGSYQPAQKWLKDRKGRELSVDDILHYQKIIVALTDTDRIMKKIDKVMEF